MESNQRFQSHRLAMVEHLQVVGLRVTNRSRGKREAAVFDRAIRLQRVERRRRTDPEADREFPRLPLAGWRFGDSWWSSGGVRLKDAETQEQQRAQGNA